MSGGVSSKELNESSLNILGQPENDSNIQNITSLSGAEADPNIQNQDEKLGDILDQLESNRGLLDNPNDIQRIMSLLQAGADPNIRSPDGKTLSCYLDEKLRDILDQLESDRGLLYYYAKHISLLLQAGADRNTQNQYGKTLSHYSNEPLLNILNALESNGDILNNIQHIILLLEAGANPNVQNQEDGKTLLHYVAECNDTGGIRFLLEVIKANPNVRDQSGKTPLDYAAKNNCLQARELLLGAGANPNVQDQSGKTPSEYATEDECRQAIEDSSHSSDNSHENKGNPATPDSSVGERNDCSNSSGDDSQAKPAELSNCNTEEDSDYYSDNSRENEGNPTTPDGSVDESNDCSNNSGDDSQVKSVKLSDCDSEDEDSSCSSSDDLFLEDSLLMKLEIPLTTSEEGLIKGFYKEIIDITKNKQEPEESILKSIKKIVNEYLEKGIRLNSSCSNDNKNGSEKGDKETVTNLIFKEIEDVLISRVKPRDETREYRGRVNDIPEQEDKGKDKDEASDIMESIMDDLLLKGGKAKESFFTGTELAQNYNYSYMNARNKKYKEIESKLISIAYEGIVNRDRQAQKEELETVEIDNQYFYMKYSQDSIIEPVKILNNEKAKELKLKVGILQIGESIVRVKGTKDGKRNYTDILKGSIEMSFTTEVGEISIYLSPSKEDSNKIEVKICEESRTRFDELKAKKKSLGENCLLGGENVLKAIEDKGFKKNGSVSTESIETTKDVPSTDLTQACLQQKKTAMAPPG
ncbi:MULTISPECIES: ankyrin repeat domain-containing protein [unclassified Wolbachia]|uniref:ankyrin repeat domain-containing protein n=1 Tax=unclassified Wolbachia TaxID=2640676 RepID=UPI00222FF9BF|nr:ankyrin repeat domain-containing protein [Wolbachia endosymbiont (group A) of Apoderus coryli]